MAIDKNNIKNEKNILLKDNSILPNNINNIVKKELK
jgi:hypothetical protein